MGQPENNKHSIALPDSPLVRWQTRRFRWGIRLVYLMVIAGLAVLLLKYPLPQMGVMRIVDEQGKPVAGAVVMMDAVRPKSNRGYYLWREEWHGPRGPYVSDTDGLVRFAYPNFAAEEFETETVGYYVRHDGYCPTGAFFTVDDRPPGSYGLAARLKYHWHKLFENSSSKKDEREVEIRRGAIIEVRGVWEGNTVRPDELLPVVERRRMQGAKWRASAEDVLCCTQMHPRDFKFFVAWLPENGKGYFSGVWTNLGITGLTNRHELVLNAGVKVFGRLSNNVPRPVERGRVNVISRIDNGLSWRDWLEVAPDGTFEFTALPAGKLEMAGICNGFVSRRGSQTNAYQANLAATAPIPQEFLISGEEVAITLEMESGTACVVTIVGPDGKPVQGAHVQFHQNLYSSIGTTVFPGNVFRSREMGRDDSGAVFEESALAEQRFAGRTNGKGMVTISDMPGGYTFIEVTHDLFELPADPMGTYRVIDLKLASGQTNHQLVVMQKKGTQVLKD